MRSPARGGGRHRNAEIGGAEPAGGWLVDRALLVARPGLAVGLGAGRNDSTLPLGPRVVDRGGGQRRPERLAGLGRGHHAALCRRDRSDPGGRGRRRGDRPVGRAVDPAGERLAAGGQRGRWRTSHRRRGHRCGCDRRWRDRRRGDRRWPERAGRRQRRVTGDRLGTAAPPDGGCWLGARRGGSDRPQPGVGAGQAGQTGVGAGQAGQLTDGLATAGSGPAAGCLDRSADA